MAETKAARHSRREALLQAAAEIFFEQGYAAASIDAIIERAGGSKRNIYSEFRNKEGLFSAIVSQNADRILSSLVIEQVDGSDLRQTLNTFGRQLMEAYMSASLLGVYRISQDRSTSGGRAGRRRGLPESSKRPPVAETSGRGTIAAWPTISSA